MTHGNQVKIFVFVFLVTDFQLNILWTFFIILLCNIVLIIFFWSSYGSTISRHFIKSSTLIEIENLRKSVEKLKLPREHTPRI
jgi:O-antigen ligase